MYCGTGDAFTISVRRGQQNPGKINDSRDDANEATE